MDAALREDDVGSRGDLRRHGLGIAASALLIVAYYWYFAHVSTSAYRGYAYRTFDLGFYDQGVWLLSRLHAPYITLVGRDLFGDHAQFSLLALVPLYWIRPDPSTLLNVQALVMALGAVPVYLLAIRRSLGPLVATVFVAAFLLHPALGQSNLENYHPDSFLIPILGFAIYFAVEDRTRPFVISCALALLCKEDAVLVVAPLALWFWWRRGRRVGGLLAGAAVVVALFDTNVVMRSLVGVSTRNAFRIPFSTCARACSVTRHLSDFVIEIFTRPVSVVRYLVAGDRPNGRPFYVWQMIAPTGLTFLARTRDRGDGRPRARGQRLQHGRVPAPDRVPLLNGAAPRARDGFRVRRQPHPVRTSAHGRGRARRRVGPDLGVPVGPVAVLTAGPSRALEPDVDRGRRHQPRDRRASARRGGLRLRRVRDARRPAPAGVPLADAVLRRALEARQGGTDGASPRPTTVEYLLLPARLDDHVAVFDSIKSGFAEVARAADRYRRRRGALPEDRTGFGVPAWRQSRKFVKSSGTPKSCSRSFWIVACRSSRFFPFTRSWSPCT